MNDIEEEFQTYLNERIATPPPATPTRGNAVRADQEATIDALFGFTDSTDND